MSKKKKNVKAKKAKKNELVNTTDVSIINNEFEENVEEKKPKKKKLLYAITIGLVVLGIGIASLILVFALYIIISSPNFDRDLLYKKESTILYDNKGKEIARIGSENRELITYDDLPQVLVDALVATEDSRFFQHNGLDGARFLVASVNQVIGKSYAGGASTLSMQVIKNTYTGKEASGIKGIIRKFTDIYMAVFKLESSSTKEEIIEFYTNSQWLGNDGNLNYSGIYGVEQASQYYFGKSVNDLNLAEASMLVGMFQNPTAYNPYTYPIKCQKRRDTVLKLMVKHGYISQAEADAASSIDVRTLLKPKKEVSTSPYQAFIDFVIDDVEQTTGTNPAKIPMKIYTTMDSDIQDVVNKVETGEYYKFPNDALQMGIAITSTENGAILALSGGRNYVAKGTNRATAIKRQPGSTAKILFDYGPSIEYLNTSTYTLLLDEPYTYSGGSSIHNWDNSYMGLMTTRNALAESRNVPALKTFQKVYKENPNYIADFVHSLGIDYGDGLYESASIGGFDGTNPLQMSAAYAAFGRGGYYIKPYSFTKIVYEDGTETENKYTKNRVMSEETAYMITDILMTAWRRNVGGYNLNISGSQLATKGGTTNLDSASQAQLGVPSGVTPDHWNISYSPDYSVAIWVGYDQTTKEHYLMSSEGSVIRKGLMDAIGPRIYKQNRTFTRPKGVVSVTVEYETFPPQLPSEYTPANLKVTELFKKGTEPSEVSTRFSQLENPKNGSATFDGVSTIRLKWTGISTPDAINETKLQEHFKKYYDNVATKYYQRRLDYNRNTLGKVVYQIFLKDSKGKLNKIAITSNTSFDYPADPKTTSYTFVVKAAYEKWDVNASSGLTINAYAKMNNVDNKDDKKKKDDKNDNSGNNNNNNNNGNNNNSGNNNGSTSNENNTDDGGLD